MGIGDGEHEIEHNREHKICIYLTLKLFKGLRMRNGILPVLFLLFQKIDGVM